MAASPLVSVVVPMYNVEEFLIECVESIRCQTLRDIEIILVDDGSPDRCGKMAEQYARLDSRIKVVHRSNGGLGPARNSGMEVATGEYIGFVDSDDWIEPDMYERLYKAARASGAQIAYAGLKTVSYGKIGTVQEHPYAGHVLHGPREIFKIRRSFYGAPPARIKDDPTPVSVCPAIFERVILEANALRFLNVRSEDKLFNTVACRTANTVTCISDAPYCYRKDEQPSITKSFDRRTIDSFFLLFRLLEQMADEEPEEFWDECHIREQRCVLDYCRVLIGMIENSCASNVEKREFVAEVLNHSTLKRACKRYPFWKLPVTQIIFYMCLRLRMVFLAQTLTKLKRR